MAHVWSAVYGVRVAKRRNGEPATKMWAEHDDAMVEERQNGVDYESNEDVSSSHHTDDHRESHEHAAAAVDVAALAAKKKHTVADAGGLLPKDDAAPKVEVTMELNYKTPQKTISDNAKDSPNGDEQIDADSSCEAATSCVPQLIEAIHRR